MLSSTEHHSYHRLCPLLNSLSEFTEINQSTLLGSPPGLSMQDQKPLLSLALQPPLPWTTRLSDSRPHTPCGYASLPSSHFSSAGMSLLSPWLILQGVAEVSPPFPGQPSFTLSLFLEGGGQGCFLLSCSSVLVIYHLYNFHWNYLSHPQGS